MATMGEKLQAIETARERFKLGGGLAEIERQHAKGKLTARERIDKLLDPGSFQEVELWTGAYKTGFDIDETEIPGDALVGGYGEVSGHLIYVWAQDATLLGGTITEIHRAKIVRLMERALTEIVPIVGIYDSEGPRVQNEVLAYNYCTYGTMLRFQTLSSGVIPQISLIMGPCIGPMALSAALSDFVFMVRNTSYMHVAPPPPDIESEKYGEARMHSRVSGGCDVLAENDEDCLRKCRELLALLPANNTQKPPVVDTADNPDRISEELMRIVPVEPSKWFDMRDVIRQVVDNGYYFEIKKDYAANLTVGFARFDGQTVGIIANNPIWKGGCEDTKSADKHARFTRFCDAFNLPLVYFTDCPAFFPSIEEERLGILRHGTMVIHATGEATVPKISVYMRKVYGGTNLVMPSTIMKADRVIAWPIIERGVMGPEGMVAVMYKGRLTRAESPEQAEEIRRNGIEKIKVALENFTYTGLDNIIDPRQTRPAIIKALKCLANKKLERPQRKHENINM